jgi:putative membrane protein
MGSADAKQVMTTDEISVELSSRRTGMSFQRTRMSADRTLMSVIRTSLSLISFGFTIFQVFSNALKIPGLNLAREAPRNFGIALVAIGVLLLVGGLAYHVQYMRHLRAERNQMIADGLIHGESKYPVSLVLLCAIVLLLIGLMAVTSMVFDVAPFA